MEQTTTTILFNGQFWIALIEKVDAGGVLSVGRYTFYREPNNNDLLDFYMHRYAFIQCYKSEVEIRTKKTRTSKEQERITDKARQASKIIQTQYLLERQKRRTAQKLVAKEERFFVKQLKKKEKRKGH